MISKASGTPETVTLPDRLSRRSAVATGAVTLFAPAVVRAQSRPVKIGVLGDYGGGRDLGGPGSVAAAKLAAEDFGGFVAGRPVEFIASDHQNKPDVAAGIARDWYDNDGVEAITDLAISSVALSVASVAAQKHRSVLVSGGAASDLTGKECSPYTTHWADDTYALSVGLSKALVGAHGKKWYFIAVDYSFGTAMLRDGSKAVEAAGGQVVGSSRYPYGTSDLSSFLLAAQSSNANLVALASTGTDTVNLVKQAAEFGLRQQGQELVGMLTFIADVHSIGLEVAQGMYIAAQYYWDDDEPSREFAQRFFKLQQRMPTKLQAATYAAVRHYLKAVDATKSNDALVLNQAMRAAPVNFFGRPAHVRRDGRVIYDLGLYQVKAPAESRKSWDYYKRLSTIQGDTAFRPEADGGCSMS